MPRFVILEHDHPSLHWDLMLEVEGVLQTWRLAQPPGRGDIAATALPDHRIMYLDYEGPVSGDRGTVRRWDAGTYTETLESRPEARSVVLIGERTLGEATLTHVQRNDWVFRMTEVGSSIDI